MGQGGGGGGQGERGRVDQKGCTSLGNNNPALNYNTFVKDGSVERTPRKCREEEAIINPCFYRANVAGIY